MGRRGHGYGSEDHFIRYRAKHPEFIDSYVTAVLPQPDGAISWLYPSETTTAEATEEPKDLSFVDLTERQDEKWRDFWPSPGNRRWDGVARWNGEWLLFEAKANEREFISHRADASPRSLSQIIVALDEVKRYLRVPQDSVWHKDYYQYANRIAVLYFLNVVAKIPARLIFLYFTGDAFPDGRPCPQNDQDWRPLIGKCHAELKLPEVHPLSDRIHDVFVPVPAPADE